MSGFAPASSAFNAMYGLPEDPFSFPQNNRPPWMDGLSGNQPASGYPAQGFSGPLPQGTNGQGFSGPLPQGPNGQGFSGPMTQGPNGQSFGGPMPQGTNGQGFSGPLPQGINGQSFGGPMPQTPTRQLEPGEVDLNDPHLTEIIRQYSKKSQALPPQQQPGQGVPNPNSSWLV
jgi:hypothetical protein